MGDMETGELFSCPVLSQSGAIALWGSLESMLYSVGTSVLPWAACTLSASMLSCDCMAANTTKPKWFHGPALTSPWAVACVYPAAQSASLPGGQAHLKCNRVEGHPLTAPLHDFLQKQRATPWFSGQKPRLMLDSSFSLVSVIKLIQKICSCSVKYDLNLHMKSPMLQPGLNHCHLFLDATVMPSFFFLVHFCFSLSFP